MKPIKVNDFLSHNVNRLRGKRDVIVDVLKFLLAITLIAWLLARGTEGLGYNWQWYRISQYIFTMEEGRLVAGPLLRGLEVTLQITCAGLVFTLVVGLMTALFRLAEGCVGRALARGFVDIIRNTPFLVQLFFIYFVLAPAFNMSRFTSAVLALSLFEGAYASEIFRAGIVSIQKGQWEAAYSLGMGAFHTYRYIILPQAIKRIIPPLTSQTVSLIKDSALVSTIAIYDLTMQGQAIIAETYLTFEIWFTVAAIYFFITTMLSMGASLFEKRSRRGGYLVKGFRQD